MCVERKTISVQSSPDKTLTQTTPKRLRHLVLVLGDQLNALKADAPLPKLYWDFLMRHEKLLSRNQRMAFQVRNLRRLDEQKQAAVRKQAAVTQSKLAEQY